MSKTTVRISLLLAALAMPAIVGGCTADRWQDKNYSRSLLGQTDFDQAFAACEKVMRSEFGRVHVQQEYATIKAEPSLFTGSGGLAGRQMRRTAKLELLRRNDRWWAFVSVQNERLDNRTYRQLQHQRTGSDTAATTPMERGEGAPIRRRQAWTKGARLRDGEKDVLKRIREELGIVGRSAE